MKIIGSVKEDLAIEKRISITPETVKKLIGKLPIFGICLGHQLLGLAVGVNVEKLSFGHHGSNHPVKVFINDKLMKEGNSSNVLKNPLNSLLWLINKLSLKGESLLKDNVVSTGTCTVAIPLEKKCNVRVDFANMGNVDFQIN